MHTGQGDAFPQISPRGNAIFPSFPHRRERVEIIAIFGESRHVFAHAKALCFFFYVY